MKNRRTLKTSALGDHALQRGLHTMERRGWTAEHVTTRTKKWSLLTGIFTRKPIHTVTYTK